MTHNGTPSLDEVTHARLSGYLSDALAHMYEAAHNADATFDWPTTTELTPEQVLDACDTEASDSGHGLLIHFDTAAAVLLILDIDPEEAALCLIAYPALRPADEGDLVAGEAFLALLHAGLTGTAATAAHHCRLEPTETLALLCAQGPGYLTAWADAGYGAPELRHALRAEVLPALADLHGFAALRHGPPTGPPENLHDPY